MELFTTKIALKSDTTFDDIWSIAEEWLTKSPHYTIDSIDYTGEDFYTQSFGEKEIKITRCEISSDKVFAIRFINPEEKNIWQTDCIYVEAPEGKRVSISLSCNTRDYKKNLPRIHKPHIIKKFIESGLCYTDGVLPICDKPIYLKASDLDLCTKIMKGEIKTPLPVVYLSINDCNPEKYSVDESILARKLSGIAHVLVEPNQSFSKKLRKSTDSKNPYLGYVGVYFSESSYKEIIAFDFWQDGTVMSDCIRETVQQALLNHDKTSDYSWNNIQIEYHRKNHESASQSASDAVENASKAKRELDDFINAFDTEIKGKNEKIESLQRQLDAKNAIIESYKEKANAQSSIAFKKSDINEFYGGELHDFILHVLSSVYKNSKDNMTTRQKELLELFLNSNSEIGTGREILKNIEEAIKEKSIKSRRAKLEKCGFTIIEGSHDKIYFHDPKYSFTLSNSPSEHRGDDNMLSDIKKKIDIYRKI